MERIFSSDIQTLFVVACQATTNDQIKSLQDGELVDAN